MQYEDGDDIININVSIYPMVLLTPPMTDYLFQKILFESGRVGHISFQVKYHCYVYLFNILNHILNDK